MNILSYSDPAVVSRGGIEGREGGKKKERKKERKGKKERETTLKRYS